MSHKSSRQVGAIGRNIETDSREKLSKGVFVSTVSVNEQIAIGPLT